MREDYYSADYSEYIPGRRRHRSGKEIKFALPYAMKDQSITLKADDKSNRSLSFFELRLKKQINAPGIKTLEGFVIKLE
jgi:hypothetical protein